MNSVEFQEKMDNVHRAYFCRMLNMKQLPEALLERYAQVKKMVDHIDGHLNPGNLAMIAVIADFGETTEGRDAKLQALANEGAAKTSAEQLGKEAEEKKAVPAEAPTMTGAEAEAAVASGAAKPVEPLDEADDKQVEEMLKPPLSAKPAWSPGMSVNVLQDGDELKEGRIVGVHIPKSTEKPIQLTVEFADDVIATVSVDEVDVI